MHPYTLYFGLVGVFFMGGLHGLEELSEPVDIGADSSRLERPLLWILALALGTAGIKESSGNFASDFVQWAFERSEPATRSKYTT